MAITSMCNYCRNGGGGVCFIAIRLVYNAIIENIFDVSFLVKFLIFFAHLFRHLSHYFRSYSDQHSIAPDFQLLCGLPDIIGALDGTHIRLSSCIGGDNDYFNRKHYPSIQLQVLIETCAIYYLIKIFHACTYM